MKAASLPSNEPQRLQSLRLLKILDTPAEERFDRITRIAQQLLGVPVVLITLIDENRQWFKSRIGLAEQETPREFAFCAHAILQEGPFVIPDALLDSRFVDNPLVISGPIVRSYAGQPLSAPDGSKLGTLCAIDHVPHEFSPAQLSLLNDLSMLVEDELKLYEAVSLQGDLAEANEKLEVEIHEREQLQAERDQLIKDLQIANRVAQENSRLKSEFLSTMSHELRTPLNAIEGFTSIMLGGMGIELSPQARNMVERVSYNSQRLLNLINDFLDLSRIESGRLDLAHTLFCPADLAQKWQTQMSSLAISKHLAFEVVIDPNLPTALYGDEEALSKVAINLLGNAIKFTSVGKVTLALQRTQANWSIVVSDTGIGIPLHAREYIFDEFRQVDSSSRRLYGGTGLGLAIVQKLVRAMGGVIMLQSEIGQGSTFTVNFPIEQTISPPSPMATSVISSYSTETAFVKVLQS